jgi:hypothetical protein
MADPMTALAVTAAAAKAGSSIYGGYSRAREMREQAAEYERRARAVDLQAKQDSAARYSELDSAMQTVLALRGARNIGFDSPTAIAIDKGIQRQSIEGLLMSQLGFSQDADSARQSGRNMMRGARRSIIAGYMGAVPGATDALGALRQPKAAS